MILPGLVDGGQMTIKTLLQRDRQHEKVARCVLMPAQRAIFQYFGATSRATASATYHLKAAKLKAFMRNTERNQYATTSEKQRNILPVFLMQKVAFELRAKNRGFWQ
jgi:hypothetical protein